MEATVADRSPSSSAPPPASSSSASLATTTAIQATSLASSILMTSKREFTTTPPPPPSPSPSSSSSSLSLYLLPEQLAAIGLWLVVISIVWLWNRMLTIVAHLPHDGYVSLDLEAFAWDHLHLCLISIVLLFFTDNARLSCVRRLVLFGWGEEKRRIDRPPLDLESNPTSSSSSNPPSLPTPTTHPSRLARLASSTSTLLPRLVPPFLLFASGPIYSAIADAPFLRQSFATVSDWGTGMIIFITILGLVAVLCILQCIRRAKRLLPRPAFKVYWASRCIMALYFVFLIGGILLARYERGGDVWIHVHHYQVAWFIASWAMRVDEGGGGVGGIFCVCVGIMCQGLGVYGFDLM